MAGPVKTQPGYDTEQIENDLSVARGSLDALNEYAEFTSAVVAGTVVAADPSNTNSLAATQTPMTQETWHTQAIGGSPAWTGTLNYRLTAQGDLQLSANNLGSPSGTPVNGTTLWTLPASYRPGHTHTFSVTCTVLNGVASGNGSMNINTSGVIQATGIGQSASVSIEAVVAMF